MSWPRAVLHLDMDAFFVNVHRLDHPEDRNIPLAVGGDPAGRGVIASASYEARRFGVRSAMPSAQALRLCPTLKIVSHVWPRIRECSHQVMAILQEYGPVEQISVDEAYVDLSDQPDPESLAADIRNRVKMETELPASVGLATSKLVAKVASDHDKPEGCTIVQPATEADFLAPLPVRVIWGIGPRTAERLATMQIRTCGELAEAEVTLLHQHFGKQGEAMQERARGIDDRPVQSERGPAKSISQEWTFREDVAERDVLMARLAKMVAIVAAAMQKQDLVAYTVFVKFRRPDFTTFTRQKTVQVGIDREAEIYQLAQAIWEEHWPAGEPMRLLGVGVSKLEERRVRQLKLDI